MICNMHYTCSHLDSVKYHNLFLTRTSKNAPDHLAHICPSNLKGNYPPVRPYHSLLPTQNGAIHEVFGEATKRLRMKTCTGQGALEAAPQKWGREVRTMEIHKCYIIFECHVYVVYMHTYICIYIYIYICINIFT